MSETYDVIVIGSGLGGLVSAAKLAREGQKVLVLEQHDLPGGYAAAYERNGITCEVGLQELDGMDDRDIKKRIFADLGLNPESFLIPLPASFGAVIGDTSYDVPEDRDKAVEVLTDLFPGEHRGLIRFYRNLTGIRDELTRLPQQRRNLLRRLPFMPILYPHIVRFLFSTVGRFVDARIRHPVLKVLLLANLFYFDDNPYAAGLLYFAAGQGGYCRGRHYIQGGSIILARKLVECITRAGGVVRTRSRATSIEATDGRVSAVRYRQGNTESVCRAPVVVSNAAPATTVESLLPDIPGRVGLKRKIRRLTPSMSFTVVTLILDRPLADIGVRHYKTLFIDQAPASLAEYRSQIASDIDKRPMLLFDYGRIDSKLTGDGSRFAIVLIPDRMTHWTDLDREAYRQRKTSILENILERLEKRYPGFADSVVSSDVATPRTMRRYTGNPEGSVYGFSQSPLQAGLFRFPIRSPVSGLYFSGAWTYPGGGFTGALWGGWSCAYEVLGREPEVGDR